MQEDPLDLSDQQELSQPQRSLELLLFLNVIRQWLSKHLGSGSLAVQVDVSNKKGVENMMREERSRFGDIDVLLNGARIMPRHQVKDITEEE